MLTKIKLLNYMSHAQTELDLAPGVNVLVGPNNCGKSAIVSALQTVLGDNDGDFMVRHGHKECVVEVHTDDPHVVIWRRRSRSISYQIDGREFARAGRGNLPDNLEECLRLSKVLANDGKEAFDVHFGLQKSPIFLIHSENETARFFSTSSDAERLLAMQRRHRENTQRAKEKQKTLTKRDGQLTVQLGTLQPLDDLETELDNADLEHRAFEEESERIAGLEAGISRLDAGLREHGKSHRIAVEFVCLEEPPPLQDTAPLESTIRNVERAERVARIHELAFRELAALQDPPFLQDTGRLEDAVQALEHATHAERRHQHELDVLAVLGAPPLLSDTGSLDDGIQQLEEAKHTLDHVRRQLEGLVELAEPPELMDLRPLELSLRDLNHWTAVLAGEGARRGALAKLGEVPALADTEPLASFLVRLERTLALWARVQVEAATLERLRDPPLVLATDGLENAIIGIDEAERRVRYEKTRLTLLVVLREPETYQDPSQLQAVVESVGRAGRAVEDLRQELVNYQEKLRALDADVMAWCAANPTCPLCGRPVDPDQLMVEAGNNVGGEHGHT